MNLEAEVAKDKSHSDRVAFHQRNSIKPKARACDVIDAVALVSCLTREELLGRSLKRQIAWPRQLLMLMLWEYCRDIGYAPIGRICGGRDHSTVIYGIDAARHRDHDAKFNLQRSRARALLDRQTGRCAP